MIEKKEYKYEKAVLVGLITKDQDEEKLTEYLDELEFLAYTAGASVEKRFTQKMSQPDSRTFVGSGKAEEIRSYIQEHEIGTVIFDDELSPSQLKNLERELEVKITRAKISIETVKGTVDETDPTIGHVKINSFAKNTAQEVENAVTDLRQKGVKKFIFDVRYNPGGLLDQALAISNMFVEEGKTILNIEDRNGKITAYKASKEYGTFKITEPYVLLVNEGSASASEILAGALKESANAKLIGSKTYGKGTVQSVVDVSKNAELKYTTAKWLTPNETWIHKTGIEPTETVSMPEYYNITIVDTREVVKEGSVSDNVKTIETILKGLGYDVKADGYFDSKTTEAVKQFQKTKGISETGEVNEQTGSALMNAIREELKKNDTQYKAAVKALQ